jgi:acyl-coenzyme A synthetase/AMP-(fatty) acid ligase
MYSSNHWYVLGNVDTLLNALKSNERFSHVKVILMDFDAESKVEDGIYSFYELMALATDYFDPPKLDQPDEDAIGALLWSSGTTSRAKAVQRTFKSFCPLLEPEYDWKM